MKHIDTGMIMRNTLQRYYRLSQNDIGRDADLKAKGIHLMTESYEIGNLGHLCIMRMNAFGGLMKMETSVLSVTGKDVPLFNLDWMKVLLTETQVAEFYDTQIDEWPHEARCEFEALKERDSSLDDYISKGHWYDDILYPCSYAKKDAKKTGRLNDAASGYIETLVRQLHTARDCDREEKARKNAEFAEQLITNGGPAVDTVIKLFGEETGRRIILKHMYGTENI